MRYSWDEDKNRNNLERHGIDFDDAKRIFEGPTVERIDDRFDYNEVRVYAIGIVNGIEITVISIQTKMMKRGELFRRGDRNPMRDASTGKRSRVKRGTGTDWNKLRRRSSAQIRRGIQSDPDAQVTDENFWKDAKIVLPMPKKMVTMRLDTDLLRWFRRRRGYQTRINAILRAYMDAHE
jgi:hypothetical protein